MRGVADPAMAAFDVLPWLVLGYGVFFVGTFLFVVVMAFREVRRGTRADVADDLSVPAGAPSPPRAVASFPSHEHGRGHGRGGQRLADRAGAQERWARDAVRCAGGRVDVAPVRCPLDEARG